MIQINIFSLLCIFILLINILHFLNNQSSERQDKSPKIAILSGNESEGNHTRIILFWNTFWEDGWFHIGKGYQPFENCLYKNCYTTRNRSLLYDPNYIIDAIVFYGVACPVNDLKKMKRFTGSKKLVYQKNQGIRPKIILLMNVRYFTFYHINESFAINGFTNLYSLLFIGKSKIQTIIKIRISRSF